MVFSDTSGKTGIIQIIEGKSGLGDAAISGNATKLAYWTNLINTWLCIVNIWIHEVDNEQPYDDANHGDYNIEEFSFTDGKQDFGINTDGEKAGLSISKIEVRNTTTLKYSDLDLMLQKDMGDDFWNQTKGTPSKYLLMGGNIVFDVPIDTTKVDKYRLSYDRRAHLFLTSDDTAEAGFNKDFHVILVDGPVMDWASDKPNLTNLYTTCYNKIFGDGNKWEGWKDLIQKFYLNRVQQYQPGIGRKKITYA